MMKKVMVNTRNFWQKIRPDGIDIGYAAIFAALLMFIGNLANILDAYDVAGSRQFLQSEIGQTITGFLSKIDDLQFSKSVVLFLFWAFVGLIVYTIVQTVISQKSSYEYKKEVGSGQYIHPESFDQAAYHALLKKQRIAQFCTITAFGVAVLVTLTGLLPKANALLEGFIQEFSISGLLGSLFGLALLTLGVTLIILTFRGVRFHTALVS